MVGRETDDFDLTLMATQREPKKRPQIHNTFSEVVANNLVLPRPFGVARHRTTSLRCLAGVFADCRGHDLLIAHDSYRMST